MRTAIEGVQDWLVRQLELIGGCKDEQEKTLLTNQYNHIGRNLGLLQLKLEQGDDHHFCKECGVIEFCSSRNRRDLRESQLCHTCDHWKTAEDIHIRKTETRLIVGGALYQDGGNNPKEKPQYLGHGGREFHILLDTGESWVTNNLWCGGTIPLKYRQTTMRDNARFLYGEI